MNTKKVARLQRVLQRLESEAARVRAQLEGAVRVDDLPLSSRAFNCLKSPVWPAGWMAPTLQFDTTADLCQWSRADLLKLKNMGKGSVDEISRVLATYGMALRS
jgi:DNA-directed RNA polymerase alpha subunit